MSEENHLGLPVYTGVKTCRYCFSDDEPEDLIDPCACTGSSRYVHQKCLITWLNSKQKNIILPGNFFRENSACELCRFRYRMDYYENPPDHGKMYMEITAYIFIITCIFLLCYILLGVITVDRFLFYDRENYWENVFVNGFVLTHLILAGIYILVVMVIAMSSPGFFGCYVCPSGDGCDGNGEGCCVILILLVIVGILGTVLIVYYDILYGIVDKHTIRKRKIALIHSFPDRV